MRGGLTGTGVRTANWSARAEFFEILLVVSVPIYLLSEWEAAAIFLNEATTAAGNYAGSVESDVSASVSLRAMQPRRDFRGGGNFSLGLSATRETFSSVGERAGDHPRLDSAQSGSDLRLYLHMLCRSC